MTGVHDGDRYRGMMVPRPRSRGGYPVHRPAARRPNFPMYAMPRPFMRAPWPPPVRGYGPPQYRPPYGAGPPMQPGPPMPSPESGYPEPRNGGGFSHFDPWSPYARGSGRRSFRLTHTSKPFQRPANFRPYSSPDPYLPFHEESHLYRREEPPGESEQLDEVEQMAQLSISSNHDPTYYEHTAVRRLAKSFEAVEIQDTPVINIRCQSSSITATFDAVSITSDEGASDSLLPRIIKPRKRRKKDRKPSNSSTTSEESKKEHFIAPEKCSADGATFVTLKPYEPSFCDAEGVCKEAATSSEEQTPVNFNSPSKPCDGLGFESHPDRVCGCDKCVTSHGFPTPPSSPSSSSSYSSKKSSSMSLSTSASSPCGDGDPSSSVLSSSGSDDEMWPCKDSSSPDRQLVRSHSEPTDAYKLISRKSVLTLAPGVVVQSPVYNCVPTTFSSYHGVGNVVINNRSEVNPSYFESHMHHSRYDTLGPSRKFWPNSLQTLKRRHSLNLQKMHLDYSLLHSYAGKSVF